MKDGGRPGGRMNDPPVDYRFAGYRLTTGRMECWMVNRNDCWSVVIHE